MKRLESRLESGPYSFFSGLHFAFVQTALYLAVGLYVSFSLISYFVVVISWLGGTLLGLAMAKPKSNFYLVHTLSTGVPLVFITLLMLEKIEAGSTAWIAAVCVCAVAGLQVGHFFSRIERAKVVSRVLFTENNGFIVGLVLSIYLFTKFGTRFLVAAPLATAALVIITLIVPHAWVTRKNAAPARVPNIDKREKISSPGEMKILLWSAGFCLFVLQMLIVRQFSFVLAACELSILATSACYMLGFSVAYALADRISRARVSRLAAGLFALQLLYLSLGQALYATLIDARFGITVLVLMFVLAGFLSSSIFAIVLPHQVGQGQSFARAYRYELIGALFAIIWLACLEHFRLPLLLPSYIVAGSVLTVILSPIKWRKPLTAAFAVVLIFFAIFGERIARYNLEVYYRGRGLSAPTILHSHTNFYHQIDIVQTQDGQKYAYLNGVRYFGSDSLGEFTYYLAELPAALLKPQRVLILGAGSMISIRRVAPFAQQITLVEIDPDVTEVSSKYFSELNQLADLREKGVDYQIIFDDARHFLRHARGTYDLIVFDISAPYYLQTASLHTTEFFDLVRGHLTDRGLFTISMSGQPRLGNTLARRLARAVSDSFEDYEIVSVPHVNGYLYGGKTVAFSEDALKKEIEATGRTVDPKFHVSTRTENPLEVEGVEPLSLKNLDILLVNNYWRIKERVFED